MAKVTGNVYRSGSKDPIQQALVKIRRGKTSQTTFSDAQGAYSFDDLEGTQWTLSALQESSLAYKKRIKLEQEENEVDIYLVAEREDTNGKRFFWVMIGLLAVLVTVYFLLHLRIWPENKPLSQVLVVQVAHIEKPLLDSTAIADEPTLQTLLLDLSSGAKIAAEQNLRLRPEDKALLIRLSDDLATAVENEEQELITGRFAALKEFIESPPQSRFTIWTEDPLRMIEILMWGFAGILVTKIIQVGWYLRKQTYQSRGFWMHLAHLTTTPLLVLVTVFLLSLVTLQFTLAGNNEVTIDLSDPRLMVAFAFIIGTSPWPLWNFIESTARKFAGSRDDDNQ
jgi:hypothetical protein